jgi:hypothetical protein
MGFFNLANAQVGPTFVLYLLMGFLRSRPSPSFGYRAYALLRADYYIDRDSLAILWGLRVEDIPLTDIEWVRPASDLTQPACFCRAFGCLARCLARAAIPIWDWWNSLPPIHGT